MDTKATTPGDCVPTLATPRETAARKAGGRCKGKRQTLKSKVEGSIGTGAKTASARAVPAATVMILDDIPTSRLLPRTQQMSQFQSWHQVWMHHTQTRCWQPFLFHPAISLWSAWSSLTWRSHISWLVAFCSWRDKKFCQFSYHEFWRMAWEFHLLFCFLSFYVSFSHLLIQLNQCQLTHLRELPSFFRLEA